MFSKVQLTRQVMFRKTSNAASARCLSICLQSVIIVIIYTAKSAYLNGCQKESKSALCAESKSHHSPWIELLRNSLMKLYSKGALSKDAKWITLILHMTNYRITSQKNAYKSRWSALSMAATPPSPAQTGSPTIPIAKNWQYLAPSVALQVSHARSWHKTNTTV